MSRIYIVTDKHTGAVESYVRAHSLNGAIRAVAAEVFVAKPATTDELYLATQAGKFDVIDATKLIKTVDIEEMAKLRAVK